MNEPTDALPRQPTVAARPRRALRTGARRVVCQLGWLVLAAVAFFSLPALAAGVPAWYTTGAAQWLPLPVAAGMVAAVAFTTHRLSAASVRVGSALLVPGVWTGAILFASGMRAEPAGLPLWLYPTTLTVVGAALVATGLATARLDRFRHGFWYRRLTDAPPTDS